MSNNAWRGMLPDEVRQADGPIYHYTDPGGLLGILTERVLWATEASGLNDTAEVSQGWDFIRDWLKHQPSDEVVRDLGDVAGDEKDDGLAWLRLAQSREGVFMCCASLADDDANQWRLYGGSARGYAIELNSGIQLVPLIAGKSPDPPDEHDTLGPRWRFWFDPADLVAVTPWLHVLYSDEQKRAALTGFVDNVRRARAALIAQQLNEDDYFAELTYLRDSTASDLARLAQLMKSPGFSGENEVRVIVSGGADGSYQFRPTPYGIVRYARLAEVAASGAAHGAAYEGDHLSSSRRPVPIRSVTLGPLIQAENNSDTIEALLHRYGPRECSVKSSKVRLRS